MKEWLVDTLGLDPDIAGAVQVIIAFVVILTLIGIFTWILARIKGMRIETARRSRQPRLAVMDSTPIDNQRRLVLVRRDAVEHLILVGGETDIVVEQTIVRGAPIVAQPQRQPFPAAVPAPQTAPAQAAAQTQPAVAAQAQPPQPQPPQPQPPQPQPPLAQGPQAQPPQAQSAQAQRPSGAPQSAPAPAQRPRPPQQQRPAAPHSGQRPGAETAPGRQPAAPAEQKKSAVKTGLVGAAAGALGFGQKKSRDDAPPAEAPNPNADAVQRALTPAQSEQQSPRPNGPAAPNGSGAPVAQTPGAPSGAPAASSPPASAPVDAETGAGAAPSVNLEQAIGKAVAQEATARPQSAQQNVPDAKPQAKLSPKDELASQLEELLNTPPPVKPEKQAPAVKPDGEQPGPKAADAAGAAPEIRSPAAPEAPKPAAPAVAPPVSTAPRPQAPQPAPAPAQPSAQPSVASAAPAEERKDADVPRVEAEPAAAKADSVPDVSPPPRADSDKTIPGGVASPKIEPRIEPQQDRPVAAGPTTGEAPKIAAIPTAPPVSSPVAPQNAAPSAPEPRVDAPEPDAKGEKSDSIASIEEEMAKLLSELSGPPKT